jgi:hypothetical protein
MIIIIGSMNHQSQKITILLLRKKLGSQIVLTSDTSLATQHNGQILHGGF